MYIRQLEASRKISFVLHLPQGQTSIFVDLQKLEKRHHNDMEVTTYWNAE